MDLLIWILIAFLFILSFAGLIYPVIPAVLLIWAGVALSHFFLEASVSWWTWSSLVLLTVIIFAADYAANMYFVKKYGSSKKGMTAATIGIIIGSFIIPPLGIIVVPFLLVFAAEYLQNKSFSLSVKSALGTLLGFLTSTLAKGLLQLIIILIFLADVIFL
ncbi:DUF456 domain-containing protein [Salipaludibacillus aurantiacus]|uniref:DUF456 domain-containing protein n=1 Tax=Salipaludibacillus aurantiacus TaxID=1601833 RepID=A0A1H9TGE4_9BACI|nr:DUF456 family protein [Salipaludibacillus aurantiacus]SER96221.1 hypothetical protein SAMN05518684_105324 [Salipaludibacillus aurantiacus]